MRVGAPVNFVNQHAILSTMLDFLGPFVPELSAGTGHTDGQTDVQTLRAQCVTRLPVETLAFHF